MPTDPSLTSDDVRVVEACAAVIDEPKAAPPDSFVLHAPLELLARAVLLSRTPATDRPRAHDRLRSLADRYAAAGPGAEPLPAPADVHPNDLVVSLAAA